MDRTTQRLLEVGFDNVSYFIKVFRRAMKCSPSEFRKGSR